MRETSYKREHLCGWYQNNDYCQCCYYISFDGLVGSRIPGPFKQFWMKDFKMSGKHIFHGVQRTANSNSKNISASLCWETVCCFHFHILTRTCKIHGKEGWEERKVKKIELGNGKLGYLVIQSRRNDRRGMNEMLILRKSPRVQTNPVFLPPT